MADVQFTRRRVWILEGYLGISVYISAETTNNELDESNLVRNENLGDFLRYSVHGGL